MLRTPTLFPCSAEDIDILARTIMGEASGEMFQGQIAVAWTVRNRAAAACAYIAERGKPHPLFGDGTIYGACSAHLQFSCWNGGPDTDRVNRATLSDPELQKAMCAGLLAITGEARDETLGSTHYFNPQIASPSWAAGRQMVCQIGRHRFFNNIA